MRSFSSCVYIAVEFAKSKGKVHGKWRGGGVQSEASQFNSVYPTSTNLRLNLIVELICCINMSQNAPFDI